MDRPPCGHGPGWTSGLFFVSGRFLSGRCCPTCGLVDRQSLRVAANVTFSYTFSQTAPTVARVSYSGAAPVPPAPLPRGPCPNCHLGPTRVTADGTRCRACGHFQPATAPAPDADPDTLLPEDYKPPEA